MRPYSNQSQNNGPNGGRQGGNRGPGHSRPGYGRSGGHPNRESHRDHQGRGDRPDRGERGDRPYRGGGSGSFNRGPGFRPDRHQPYRDRDRGQSYGNRREGNRPQEQRHEHSAPRGPRSSWVEVTGKSVEEAIEEALKRYQVGRNDLNTEVVDQGSKGFLGIGSKPARVKVALRSGAVMPFAQSVLAKLLKAMDLPDEVKSQKDSDGNPVLNILGPSSGTLIGRHGHTLESLQYLVSKIVQRVTGDDHVMIVVDVENYLERQKDKLKELAVSLADKARETGVDVPMRPMNSKDRRVVHLTLKDHEHVTTESRGEGLRRRVVIVPKVKAAAAPAVEGSAPPASETPEAPLPYSPESMAAVTPAPAASEGQPAEEDEDSFGNR